MLGPTSADTVCFQNLCAESVRFVEATSYDDKVSSECDGILGMGATQGHSTGKSVCSNKIKVQKYIRKVI